MAENRFYVTHEMRYDDFHLEAGEIFQPLGRPNDATLIKVEYFKPIKNDYPHGFEEAQCTRCGKIFVDITYKIGHDKPGKCPAGEAVVTDIFQEIAESGGRIVQAPEFEPATP